MKRAAAASGCGTGSRRVRPICVQELAVAAFTAAGPTDSRARRLGRVGDQATFLDVAPGD